MYTQTCIYLYKHIYTYIYIDIYIYIYTQHTFFAASLASNALPENIAVHHGHARRHANGIQKPRNEKNTTQQCINNYRFHIPNL